MRNRISQELLAQLHITYADGRTEIVGSDERWRAALGPIQTADFYNGEVYDAQQEKPGWDQVGFDDSDWSGVCCLEHPKDILVAQAGPFVYRHEELRPLHILRSPKGESILDFGQNTDIRQKWRRRKLRRFSAKSESRFQR